MTTSTNNTWTVGQHQHVLAHLAEIKTDFQLTAREIARELGFPSGSGLWYSWLAGSVPSPEMLLRIELYFKQIGYQPPTDPEGITLSDAIHQLRTYRPDGEVTAFCRLLGVVPSSFYNWKRNKTTPQLPSIVQFLKERSVLCARSVSDPAVSAG